MPRQYNILGVNDVETFLANNLPNYIQNGQKIYSGYKNILIVYKTGDYEADCTLEETDDNIVFQTLNLHIDNKAVWTLEPKLVYNRDYSEWISCLCIINGVESFAPVCIINPDLLPRIGDGETIQARVIAFSVGLDVFATEEEMEESFPIMQGMKAKPELEGVVPNLNGKRIGIAQGLIFPSGFLSNHQIPIDSNEEHQSREYDYNDDVGLICGKIVGLRTLDKGNEQDISCRIITVKTKYGDLDICVADDEQDYSVGHYILGGIILSADVRAGEYENGAIFDEPHLLKLLYEALENKDFSRFEKILSDDCVLLQKDASDIIGSGNVIKYLDEVIKTNESFCQEFDCKIDNGVLLTISTQAKSHICSFKIRLSDKKIAQIAMDLLD